MTEKQITLAAHDDRTRNGVCSLIVLIGKMFGAVADLCYFEYLSSNDSHAVTRPC